MNKLQDALPDSVMVRGRRVRLDFDFRAVLRMLDVLRRDDLMPEAKAYNAIRCLTRRPWRPMETLAAVQALLFDPKAPGREEDGKKLTDFEQDAPMIRAAFRQVYGVDLWRDDLHWLEFIELLRELPEGNRYMDVLGIRARPLPEATKYNQAERDWLVKAKAACALDMSEEEQAAYYEKAVGDVFHALLGFAKAGDTP